MKKRNFIWKHYGEKRKKNLYFLKILLFTIIHSGWRQKSGGLYTGMTGWEQILSDKWCKKKKKKNKTVYRRTASSFISSSSCWTPSFTQHPHPPTLTPPTWTSILSLQCVLQHPTSQNIKNGFLATFHTKYFSPHTHTYTPLTPPFTSLSKITLMCLQPVTF